MSAVNFVNLSNGLLCPLSPATISHFCRIQSTHCEAKNWPGVLYGAGPDLLMHAAMGYDIVIHDQSERHRRTRALWQGLAFVRRACQVTWNLEVTPALSRSGVSMDAYLDDQVRQLPKAVYRYIRYYRKFCADGAFMNVSACSCANVFNTEDS